MFIPERSSRVKKWLISKRAVLWVAASVLFLLLIGSVTTITSLRYLAHRGEFEEALLKNQYLEGKLQSLRNEIATAKATLVRIQNFEEKLRVLARVDTQSTGGIGPISEEDQDMMDQKNGGETLLASVGPGELSPEFSYRMRSMELSVDDLHRRAGLQEQSLQEVYEILKDQKTVLASTPSIWPTRGWLTSRFGYRISPFTGLRRLHEGIDVAGPIGTKIYAPADGVVTHQDTERGYGKVLVLNHGYGIVTRFAHNSEHLVKVGQKVKRGDPIAKMGNTGRSTGPHLHYEVRINGIPVNPMRYILN